MIALLFPCLVLAGTCEQWVAKIVSIQGSVQARSVGEEIWRPAKLNDTYCSGDMIRVLERSRAAVALVNTPVLRLDQNTTITFNGIKEETSLLELIKGVGHFFSRQRRNLKIFTPFVNGTVEGTEFLVRVEEDKTLLSIFEGKVLAENEAGSLTITSGQSAVAEAGKAPVMRVVVRPRDAVQWALYYPPVIYPYEEFKEGDPRFHTQRASSLLSVGRVEDAEAEIKKALDLDQNNSQAFALQSVIAVTQNEKEKALNLARKAIEADPKSASARIALSYAQQANFDLEGARSSLKEAVQVSPENALAWARLAEMQLSFGELDEALEAAQRAVSLSPELSRTQTVLGFAYLTQVKTEESKGAFQKAIELDQADPLPRLGLGLARIRESDLQEGRRELEIAAGLDPDNSLIRSYLGKGYFEEKRDKQTSEQYSMAKELDPLDPTPFFYDAIQKQTTNRPVEALHDLQKAIELNDNRAVYRSKLLLDSDLAARSASLARIYSDLGFQQLALVEGWKSVNTDPANFSAHRFLADSYSVLPRHEIARVSELLQSQLLQPINITPIQPRLAESNLFVISGGGPADVSFNEFNPLFNRDRIALQASSIYGENNTLGDEIVVSGIYKNASFSVGQYHYETDGFRKNNDLSDNIYNAFLQINLTHKTSVQTEFRYRDTEKGDLQLRFDPDDINLHRRYEDEISTIRLGFHHSFSPNSDLIGNFMYQDWDINIYDEVFPFIYWFDIKGYAKALGGELQHLFSSKYIKTIVGTGYFNVDSELEYKYWFIFYPEFPGPLLVPEARDVRHSNLYLYSYINFPKNVTFTVGGSADFYNRELPRGDYDDKNQFNPKFGITWNPVPNTTLRASVFRVLKRTLVTDQTLEPTQVAGFNQFYDDYNGTESWRYGVAVDQKFSESIYGGVECSHRDLPEVPWVDQIVDPPKLKEAEWEEKQLRAYLYWTPQKWLALSADYLWERFEREQEFADGIKNVETHRVPLGINFYHPSGLSTMLKATYINQKGGIEPSYSPMYFIPSKNDFWLVDAAISYRLSKRVGFITVGAKNLFDKSFKYFDTYFGSNLKNPGIQPDRLIFVRLTLSL